MSELCFRTARELVGLMAAGEVSATEVARAHLDQVTRVNPSVNAVVSLDPEITLADARAADEARAAGRSLGPLHGLPMAFKDTHDAAGFPTTYGSPIHAANRPAESELIVARLRAAGVVRLGKTNVPEFASGSHTFNNLFGTTRNPYDLTRSAGGSSGGAAASLAGGMQPLADGSDMGGSLRNPASFCNVVGLRPSPGRVPIHPAPLPWQTLTVQGPMARNVEDLALMLSVIAGPDDRVPLTISEDPAVFAAPLDRDVTGLRIAWSPDLGGAVPVEGVVIEVIRRQLRLFEDLGCEVIEVEPDFSGAEECFRILRAWQFQATFGELLATHPADLKPSLTWNVQQGLGLSGSDVARAQRLQGELFQRFSASFDDYDALVLPTSQVVPFDAALEYPPVIDGVAQDTYLDWMRSCYYVSVLGLPALAVPAGFTPGGLPVGMQLVGPHRGERRLLEIGHAFQGISQPQFVRPDVALA
ncbi:amidase [Nocardioides carbamazepini]|uniref:amidase n=1 Tax=Nocardioides carbamazepini TaxID=2854259 RepID=UPI002149F18A|nr:amidase [Nocardioides carbamazepini]MCR1781869.1 amidase [Nocardioides carbamazepini]